jgi:hypothetical protein
MYTCAMYTCAGYSMSSYHTDHVSYSSPPPLPPPPLTLLLGPIAKIVFVRLNIGEGGREGGGAGLFG